MKNCVPILLMALLTCLVAPPILAQTSDNAAGSDEARNGQPIKGKGVLFFNFILE